MNQIKLKNGLRLIFRKFLCIFDKEISLKKLHLLTTLLVNADIYLYPFEFSLVEESIQT